MKSRTALFTLFLTVFGLNNHCIAQDELEEKITTITELFKSATSKPLEWKLKKNEELIELIQLYEYFRITQKPTLKSKERQLDNQKKLQQLMISHFHTKAKPYTEEKIKTWVSAIIHSSPEGQEYQHLTEELAKLPHNDRHHIIGAAGIGAAREIYKGCLCLLDQCAEKPLGIKFIDDHDKALSLTEDLTSALFANMKISEDEAQDYSTQCLARLDQEKTSTDTGNDPNLRQGVAILPQHIATVWLQSQNKQDKTNAKVVEKHADSLKSFVSPSLGIAIAEGFLGFYGGNTDIENAYPCPNHALRILEYCVAQIQKKGHQATSIDKNNRFSWLIHKLLKEKEEYEILLSRPNPPSHMLFMFQLIDIIFKRINLNQDFIARYEHEVNAATHAGSLWLLGKASEQAAAHPAYKGKRKKKNQLLAQAKNYYQDAAKKGYKILYQDVARLEQDREKELKSLEKAHSFAEQADLPVLKSELQLEIDLLTIYAPVKTDKPAKIASTAGVSAETMCDTYESEGSEDEHTPEAYLYKQGKQAPTRKPYTLRKLDKLRKTLPSLVNSSETLAQAKDLIHRHYTEAWTLEGPCGNFSKPLVLAQIRRHDLWRLRQIALMLQEASISNDTELDNHLVILDTKSANAIPLIYKSGIPKPIAIMEAVLEQVYDNLATLYPDIAVERWQKEHEWTTKTLLEGYNVPHGHKQLLTVTGTLLAQKAHLHNDIARHPLCQDDRKQLKHIADLSYKSAFSTSPARQQREAKRNPLYQ